MEIYYKGKLGIISYDEDINAIILKSAKLEGHNFAIDEEYKELISKYLEAFLHYKVEKVLMDLRDFVFPMTDEMEKWTQENISKKTAANGLKYVAYVYPQDIVTKFGLENYVEDMIKEFESNGPVRLIFSDYDKAYQWIKSK